MVERGVGQACQEADHLAGLRGAAHGDAQVKAEAVLGHLERLAAHGEDIDVGHLLQPERFERIRLEIERAEDPWLTPIKEALGDGYSYEEIRLARLQLQRSPSSSNESRSMMASSSSSGSSGR